MTSNKARQAYVESSEKPTNVEIQSMCLTGGRGAMRQMLVVGGWDKDGLIATNLIIVLELGDLSQYEFGDLSTTSTWISSDTVMPKIRFVTGSVTHKITPNRRETLVLEPLSLGFTYSSKQRTA